MHKVIIDLLMDGYDILLNNLRTKSGLLAPGAKDHVEIILQKRLPGLQRKGGAGFAKGMVPWKDLSDRKVMEDILLKDLKPKVDSVLTVKKYAK